MTARRPGGVLALVVAVLVVVGTLVAPPAAAQDTTTIPEVRDVPIIPEPNSGRAPEEAGDRGGGLQLLVLGLVVVTIAGGGGYVTWQSRRARRSR